MNVNIFPTGTGSARHAANYLLGNKDHTGKVRSVKPELLHGNADTFCAIADSTSRVHKYTSGAIAFRDNEHPTPEQIQQVIDAFRATFLPRLKEGENYADMWVMHRDKGNVELHFLYANTELTTGKQLNIHPPGQKNIEFFNNFTCVVNDSLGYAQVTPDPLKAALSKLDHKSPDFKEAKAAKELLGRDLQRKILSRKITNRDELIAEISAYMPVTRVGNNYITVQLPGHVKGTRLKGPLFTEGSDYQQLIEQHRQSKIPQFLTPEEAKAAREKLVMQINERATFNVNAYLKPKKQTYRRKTTATLATTKTPSKAVYGVQSLILPSKVNKPATVIELEVKEPEHKAQPAPVKDNHPAPQLNDDIASTSTDEGTSAPSSAGIEAQIGSLNAQIHNLRILIQRARGSRLVRIQAKLIALEAKVSALNSKANIPKYNSIKSITRK